MMEVFGLVVASIAVVALFVCFYKHTTADGKATFAYIVYLENFEPVGYGLYANRPWCSNLCIGVFNEFNDAVDAAKKYGLELR